MPKIDSKELYLQFKKGDRAYKEETHCPMILEVMNNEGTMVAFCKKAQISDALFYKWINKHKVFARCYAFGKILSRANWEQEGEDGKSEEFFNFDHWRLIGAQRYGIGKNRVRFGVNPIDNPYEQYKQLVDLARQEEFSASEIKQLMESINVGIRAYESFQLQEQIDKMQEDILRGQTQHANNTIPIEEAPKDDISAVHDSVCQPSSEGAGV
jgi:hypothetical protein